MNSPNFESTNRSEMAVDDAAEFTPALESTDTERKLITAQRHLNDAQQRIARLNESNDRLQRALTSLAQVEARATYNAYHDELTGLPNRRLLLDRLHQALEHARRHRKQVVLLLLDLDGFKTINDDRGHAIGDKLLQAIAGRLRACIRSTDTACRYGGDEFIVMLPDIADTDQSAHVERKIHEQLREPYFIDDAQISMNVSIGSAVFPTDAKNHTALLKYADAAMYRAKPIDRRRL